MNSTINEQLSGLNKHSTWVGFIYLAANQCHSTRPLNKSPLDRQMIDVMQLHFLHIIILFYLYCNMIKAVWLKIGNIWLKIFCGLFDDLLQSNYQSLMIGKRAISNHRNLHWNSRNQLFSYRESHALAAYKSRLDNFLSYQFIWSNLNGLFFLINASILLYNCATQSSSLFVRW